MVKKSKLLTALDAHRGRDYEAEKKKKQVKAAEKRKRERSAKQLENGLVNSDEARENIPSVPANGVGGSFEGFSEEDDEIEHATKTAPESIPQPKESLDVSESEAEPESDVPLSDLEEEDLEDTVPHQRLTINNGPALIASRNRVTVIKHSETPFHYHNSLISKLEPAATTISDPNDDLTRELEFYRIAREASITARALLKSEKVPFTRPTDYFAEMVKSDEHMGRVKKKMYDEAASKKAAEEARRLRDAKKFGKAVQIAKEQERAKEKRQTLDKIKDLKRSKFQKQFRTFASANMCILRAKG